MKKLLFGTLLLASVIGLTSCEITVLEPTTKKAETQYHTSDFIKFEILSDNDYTVLRDVYTDVLYIKDTGSYNSMLSPIMEADGTPLTFAEWQARN